MIIEKTNGATGLEDELFLPDDIESKIEQGENSDNKHEDFFAIGVQNNQVAARDG